MPHRWSRACPAFVVTCGLAAQLQFAPLGKEHVPGFSAGLRAVPMVGDVNGDGHPDVLSVHTPALSRFLLNDGTGTFAVGSFTLPWAANESSGFLIDVDRDRDLDAVIQNWVFWPPTLQLAVARNDGRGNFASAVLSPLNGSFSLRRAVDVDGDGLLDLVGGSMVVRSLGGGTFYQPNTGLRVATAAAFGDLDGDGDLDCVVVDGGIFTTYYQQSNLQFSRRFETRSTMGGYISDAALVDVDADGQRDLAIILDAGDVVVVRNLGLGQFADRGNSAGRVNRNSGTFHAGDVDGDADDDLLVSGASPVELFVNRGNGTLVQETGSRLPRRPMLMEAGFSDVDGDGDLDIWSAYRSVFRIDRNDGAGFFEASVAPRLEDPAASGGMAPEALVDMDRDGDRDLLAAVWLQNWRSGVLYRNDGLGRFQDITPQWLRSMGAQINVIAHGDVDLDGDVDAVIGCANPPWGLLLLNDGTGNVVQAPLTLPNRDVRDALLFDADGDSLVDLYSATQGGSGAWHLFRNQGGGVFRDETAARLPPVSPWYATAWRARSADLDGDGDLDLVTSGYSPGLRLLLNDGNGRFHDEATRRFPYLPAVCAATELVDVDGDRDLDIVCLQTAADPILFRNTGPARFEEAIECLPPFDPRLQYPAAAHALDVDVDGDSDLLVIGRYGSVHQLWRNDGSGRYAAVAGALADASDYAAKGVVGDVDADGDLDLVLGRDSDVGAWLWSNLQRHANDPLLARLGMPYELRLTSRPGTNPGELALPLFAGSLARTPIDFGSMGLLWLDPAAAIIGPLVPLSSPSGLANIRFTWPRDARLHGQPLAFQALFLDGSNLAASRFSNLVADRLVR